MTDAAAAPDEGLPPPPAPRLHRSRCRASSALQGPSCPCARALSPFLPSSFPPPRAGAKRAAAPLRHVPLGVDHGAERAAASPCHAPQRSCRSESSTATRS
nr:unnamed protein product [Digitaria exilis]CAB3503321.1 unnamed protein product [Digitaria exilis]